MMTGSRGHSEERKNLLNSLIKDSVPKDIEVIRVGPGNAVIVTIGKRRSIAEEGHLLMVLEEMLRGKSGIPYEVYLLPMADENKLRRDAGEKIIEWESRRNLLRDGG